MTFEPASRVLVTGASGGTGRHLLEQLAETDVTVRALTRSEDRRSTLEAAGADEVVVGDLLDTASTRRAVEDCDRDSSAYPRLPVSDERSDRVSEQRSEQAGVERTA